MKKITLALCLLILQLSFLCAQETCVLFEKDNIQIIEEIDETRGKTNLYHYNMNTKVKLQFLDYYEDKILLDVYANEDYCSYVLQHTFIDSRHYMSLNIKDKKFVGMTNDLDFGHYNYILLSPFLIHLEKPKLEDTIEYKYLVENIKDKQMFDRALREFTSYYKTLPESKYILFDKEGNKQVFDKDYDLSKCSDIINVHK